jgi:hypothetical protein
VLSFVGRLFFGSKIGDFHCGLRGFRRDSILRLELQTGGMEFASEMVVRSTLAGYDIREVPTTLSPDGRSRPPHLSTWRDGWRHLRFLCLYSPRWLFLIPGLIIMALGIIAGIALAAGPIRVGDVAFDVDTLVGASAAVVIGFQAVMFALLTKVYAMEEGFLPHDKRVQRIIDSWSLERGLVVGGLLALAGLVGLVASLSHWQVHSFGQLEPRHSLRLVVPSATALIMSFQMIFASLFVSILAIRRRSHPPVTDPVDEAADVVDAAAHKVQNESRDGESVTDQRGEASADARAAEDIAPAETAPAEAGVSAESAAEKTV